MGHLIGKDVWRKVGRKIDGLTMRAPWNEALHRIVQELYSAEEADVFVRMPYSFSTLDRIAQVAGYEKTRLRNLLEGLADKGLVVDFWIGEQYQYMPSPLFIGIFEFTMMRSGSGVDSRTLGKLFHEYLSDGAAFAENCKGGTRVSVIRALPHEESLGDHVEILDYEKTSAIIDRADRFSLGICSCRHEKLHAGTRLCGGPLQVCSSFGRGADYLIRHGLAREASKGEMLDNLARSKEAGYVLSADNVQKGISFICHCCSCCCNVLQAIGTFGCSNVIVTSSFIAQPDTSACRGCPTCAQACPITAIDMVPLQPSHAQRKKEPRVNAALCMGCGVCALKCRFGAMKLYRRGQRVIHPETTFERVILQCLERGTLQNQIFDNPSSLTQSAVRAILGAFLALSAVKKALMSDALRSRFLDAMKAGVRLQGKGELTNM
jgi:ferredoxin